MTRFSWETAPLADLIERLQGRLSPRQARLVACAYVRTMPTATRGSGKQALDVAERFADGKATAFELAAARYGGRFLPGHPAWAVCWEPDAEPVGMMERALAWSTTYVADRGGPVYSAPYVEPPADLMREVVAALFETVTIDPSWLVWGDGTVPRLARAIYDDRDFAQMPILGDALEEAGCGDARILEHCRSKSEHVRGCWLLDALLGLK
jgi:hypothetical protein